MDPSHFDVDSDPWIHLSGIVDTDPCPEWIRIWVRVPKMEEFCLKKITVFDVGISILNSGFFFTSGSKTLPNSDVTIET